MQTGLGRLRHLAGCIAALLIALPVFAQFGHPLKGTWSGDWGPTKDKQTHIVLEFQWDGKDITGKINPGPKAVVPEGDARCAELDGAYRSRREKRGRRADPLRHRR